MPGSEPDNGVKRIFDRIAPGYDLMNKVLSGGASLYWDYRFRRALPEKFQGRCLDLGGGTLAFWRSMARRWPGAVCLGFDLSRPMLEKGLAALGPKGAERILAVQASGLELPLAAASVDMAVCRFALRNMQPRAQALAEIFRVLKPGCAVYFLEFGSGRQRLWGGLYNFYLKHGLPRLAAWFSPVPGAYDYLVQSIFDFPEPEALAAEMRRAGFADVSCRSLSSGIVSVYLARKRC